MQGQGGTFAPSIKIALHPQVNLFGPPLHALPAKKTKKAFIFEDRDSSRLRYERAVGRGVEIDMDNSTIFHKRDHKNRS